MQKGRKFDHESILTMDKLAALFIGQTQDVNNFATRLNGYDLLQAAD